MQKAFTLIELLVVVLIIGILSAIALPQYQKAVMKARFMQLKIMAHAIANAQEVYYLANNEYSPHFSNLDIDTPAYKEATPGTTSESRTFSFGKCWVIAGDEWGSRVACEDTQDSLTYYIFFQHSSATPGRRMCRTENTDLSSAQNGICKADSGAASGQSSGVGGLDWVYVN